MHYYVLRTYVSTSYSDSKVASKLIVAGIYHVPHSGFEQALGVDTIISNRKTVALASLEAQLTVGLLRFAETSSLPVVCMGSRTIQQL